MKTLKLTLAVMSVMVLAVSCKKDKFVAAVVEQKEILVNGSATTGNFLLYNLESGTVVANSDSASNKWDFGIRFEKFIINSNASGPGTASVQIVSGVFDSYSTAPSTKYAYDTTSTKLAIKGSDWYTYDPITRSFAPKAGKIFIFKTCNNKYAKLEILSADPTDDNGVAVVPPTRPTKIKYKFRKAVQANGSNVFF
jgi:hypothetical protein